jgi:hypothetical protein
MPLNRESVAKAGWESSPAAWFEMDDEQGRGCRSSGLPPTVSTNVLPMTISGAASMGREEGEVMVWSLGEDGDVGTLEMSTPPV